MIGTVLASPGEPANGPNPHPWLLVSPSWVREHCSLPTSIECEKPRKALPGDRLQFQMPCLGWRGGTPHFRDTD